MLASELVFDPIELRGSAEAFGPVTGSPLRIRDHTDQLVVVPEGHFVLKVAGCLFVVDAPVIAALRTDESDYTGPLHNGLPIE